MTVYMYVYTNIHVDTYRDMFPVAVGNQNYENPNQPSELASVKLSLKKKRPKSALCCFLMMKLISLTS